MAIGTGKVRFNTGSQAEKEKLQVKRREERLKERQRRLAETAAADTTRAGAAKTSSRAALLTAEQAPSIAEKRIAGSLRERELAGKTALDVAGVQRETALSRQEAESKAARERLATEQEFERGEAERGRVFSRGEQARDLGARALLAGADPAAASRVFQSTGEFPEDISGLRVPGKPRERRLKFIGERDITGPGGKVTTAPPGVLDLETRTVSPIREQLGAPETTGGQVDQEEVDFQTNFILTMGTDAEQEQQLRDLQRRNPTLFNSVMQRLEREQR
jgi:hypothetical protein